MSRADQCKIVLPGTRLRGGGKRQKNGISASQAVAMEGERAAAPAGDIPLRPPFML